MKTVVLIIAGLLATHPLLALAESVDAGPVELSAERLDAVTAGLTAAQDALADTTIVPGSSGGNAASQHLRTTGGTTAGTTNTIVIQNATVNYTRAVSSGQALGAGDQNPARHLRDHMHHNIMNTR